MSNYGLGLFSSLINWGLQEASNAISHKRNVKTAKEFMKLEDSYYKDNLRLSNEMNRKNYMDFESVQGKKQQLLDAGFNPMLASMAPSGGVGTASASSPHQSAPQTSSSHISPFEITADYMTLKSMKLDIERKQLENEELRTNIKNTATNTRKTEGDIHFSEQSNPINLQILANAVESGNLDNKLKNLQVRSVDSSVQRQILDDTIAIFKSSEEISYYNDNKHAYRQILETQTNLFLNELKQSDLNLKLTNAQIAKVNAETSRIILDKNITKEDRDRFNEFYKGLTAKEKEEYQKAVNNLVDYYGDIVSKEQAELFLHQTMQDANITHQQIQDAVAIANCAADVAKIIIEAVKPKYVITPKNTRPAKPNVKSLTPAK